MKKKKVNHFAAGLKEKKKTAGGFPFTFMPEEAEQFTAPIIKRGGGL